MRNPPHVDGEAGRGGGKAEERRCFGVDGVRRSFRAVLGTRRCLRLVEDKTTRPTQRKDARDGVLPPPQGNLINGK